MADPILRVYLRGEEREVPPMWWSPDDIFPMLKTLVYTHGERRMWVIIVGAPGVPDALCAVHSVWLGTPPPTLPEHGRLQALRWPEEPVRFPRT